MQAGWVLFGMACLNSTRLPAEAFLVGPAVMIAGVAMIEWDKRESRRRRDSGFGDAVSHSNVRRRFLR
jgi:hypothetical protein